jgi:hypothetical protein
MSKTLIIDFLYLDLTICQRCQSTEQSLMSALDALADQLRLEGYSITLNKININNAALAIKHRFVSSPTIRVNHRDIADELVETVCEDCGSLCGDNVTCRMWSYHGQQYASPPIAMVKEAILLSLEDPSPIDYPPYRLPDNLKLYYDGLSHKEEAYPTITLKHL